MHLPLRRTETDPAERPTTGGARWRALRRLLVPLLVAAVATAAAPGWIHYRIRQGDTLESIAKRYHTTVARLDAVNQLPGNGDLIIAGEFLRVPVASSAVVTRRVTVRLAHRVVRGDNLIKISRTYGVSPATVAAVNHLPASKIVRLGSVLSIPVTRTVRVGGIASGAANSFAGRTYPNATVAAAARNRASLASRPTPSRAHVRALIVRTAKRNGVDPALALAVSWQESGWNMRRVSVANAIGAMQVIPSTGAWASSVVGRRLNLLDTEDNVLAGVVLLRVLTHSGATLATAVAGYYQGLASVRHRGMFADTKAYVASVLALRARFS